MFTYSDPDPEPMRFAEARPDVYPYLLVNIGSGVSMIKVSGPREFQRVGGTHLGGGTFWGILSLLTGARTFDDMLAMADRGDNSGVDMLVGDIYGMDYSKIGLKSTAIASTFGKVFRLKNAAERDAEDGEGLSRDSDSDQGEVKFAHEDMSRSLLYAIRCVSPQMPSSNCFWLTAAVTTSAKSHTSNQKNTKSNTSTLAVRSFEATDKP